MEPNRFATGACGLLMVSLAVLGAPLGAAEAPPLRLLTPPDLSAPTPVVVNVYDLQVFSIEEQAEVFQVGGRLSMRWIDPRQAFDPDAAGHWRLEYQGEAATDKLGSDVWWPEVEFVDAVGSRDRVAVNLTVDSDGEVWYRERFNVQIKQDFFLGDFPYDGHTISFAVEPFSYGSQAVRFVADESGYSTASWEPTEWVVADPVLEIAEGVGHVCLDPAGEAAGEQMDGACEEGAPCPAGTTCETLYGFPRITASMDIARVSSHYNGNIILPLVLIVLMGSAVFWMDLERTHLGDRLGLAFTTLLTVVAFDFVTSSSLPKLWYSTVLDHIVTASYVALVLIIAASVVVDRLDAGATDGRRRSAVRLNRVLRWGVPVAYLGCLALLVLGAG